MTVGRRAHAIHRPPAQRVLLLRVATLEGIQPTALKDLNGALQGAGGRRQDSQRASLGGVKTAAEIINLLGSNVDTVVLESIRSHDPDLAQKIMDKMFVFDDVAKLDDRAIQTVLKGNCIGDAHRALKGCCQSCASASCRTCRRVLPKPCVKT